MSYAYPPPISDTGTLSLRDKTSAQQVYIIPFADILTAAASSLGTPHDWVPGVICKTFAWEPLGNQSSDDFLSAKITVGFGPDDVKDDNSNYGEITLNMNCETMSLPKSAFAWVESDGDGHAKNLGDDPNAPSPFKVVPSDDLQLKKENLTSVPYDTIYDLRGKVNSADIDFSGTGDGALTFAAEHVLFMGAETSKTFDKNGVNNWTVTYHFAIKPAEGSWNQFWSVDLGGGPGWRTLTPKPYESADLTPLFS